MAYRESAEVALFSGSKMCCSIEWNTSQSNTAVSVSYQQKLWIYGWVYATGFRLTGGYNTGSSVDTYDTGTYSVNGGTGGWWTQVASHWQAQSFARRNSAYSVRVFAWCNRDGSGAAQAWSDYITVPALPTPSAPTGCRHTRDGDNQNTVSWANTGSNPRSTNRVERSVDGGGYSQVASVSGSATSYVDAATQPDHSYSYRVRAAYTANGYTMYSGYASASTPTWNSPAAPTELAASRNEDNSVTVTFRNQSLAATGIEYQRSNDAADWSEAVAVEGAGIEAFTDTPGGGTWHFRARNTRGGLASAWSAPSNAVVTIIAPAAPTLVSPLNGSVVNKAVTPTRLAWSHNPIDGSTQTAAQIRLSTDGGATWGTPIQVAGAAGSYDHPTDWAVNAQVLWQVRTKGAHEDYGAWSSSASFTVRQVPQVSITSPENDDVVITSMPIVVTWSYSDQSGTQLSAVLRLLDANGRQLWHRSISGPEARCDIYAADILPDNKAGFTLQLSVASTSTLTAQTARGFTTDYLEPALPIGMADVDKSKASVSLLALAGEDPEAPETVAMGIIRRHADGRQVVLADHVPSGTSCNDPYCPIEQDVTYVFVAYTETGSLSRLEVPVRIAGKMSCWINYGDSVCTVWLDSSYGRETEHDRELFETAGSEWPMAFYGDTRQMSGSISGLATRSSEGLAAGHGLPAEVRDFDGLAAYTGAVVIRMPHWDALVADITVSQSADVDAYEGVTISWRRVRNHGLAI